MSKQNDLAMVLAQLAHAMAYGTLAEAGELYTRAEVLSINIDPAIASKPMLMQVVRKHLMQAFGAEVMRIGTNISSLELADYDVVTELGRIIDELNRYEQG